MYQLPSSAPKTSPSSSSSKRKLFLVLAVVSVMLALGGITAWLLTRGKANGSLAPQKPDLGPAQDTMKYVTRDSTGDASAEQSFRCKNVDATVAFKTINGKAVYFLAFKKPADGVPIGSIDQDTEGRINITDKTCKFVLNCKSHFSMPFTMYNITKASLGESDPIQVANQLCKMLENENTNEEHFVLRITKEN